MPFSFLSNGSNIKVPKELAKKTKGKQQEGGNITTVKKKKKNKRQNQDRDKIYKEKRKLT
jgi:hypothetical protein